MNLLQLRIITANVPSLPIALDQDVGSIGDGIVLHTLCSVDRSETITARVHFPAEETLMRRAAFGQRLTGCGSHLPDLDIRMDRGGRRCFASIMRDFRFRRGMDYAQFYTRISPNLLKRVFDVQRQSTNAAECGHGTTAFRMAFRKLRT